MQCMRHLDMDGGLIRIDTCVDVIVPTRTVQISLSPNLRGGIKVHLDKKTHEVPKNKYDWSAIK